MGSKTINRILVPNYYKNFNVKSTLLVLSLSLKHSGNHDEKSYQTPSILATKFKKKDEISELRPNCERLDWW